MNNLHKTLLGVVVLLAVGASTTHAQRFDFDRLTASARDYTVVVKINMELSFGMQTMNQEIRLLGTLVNSDGLVLVDGSSLSNELTGMSGMTVRATPTRIDVMSLAGTAYKGELVGTDRFTRLGFIQLNGDFSKELRPVRFARNQSFRVGEWMALFMLLPEFVKPPIAGDIGMLSTMVNSPERFPLIVGFNPMEVGSVIYNERLVPVGVLGALLDPTAATTDESGMLESFEDSEIPLLGVITAERVERLFTAPPRKGQNERAWLGISMQALTPELATALHVPAHGGVIVNEVVKGSPADAGGLAVGDIIWAINEQPVDVDMDEKIAVFQRRVAEMPPGAEVAFAVVRPQDTGNANLTVTTQLQKAPVSPSDAATYENKSLELKVRELVFADFMRLNLEMGSLTGIVVAELKGGGLASVGGLELGDVIQRIGSESIADTDSARKALEKLESDKVGEVVFFVWRDSKTLFVNVKTDWK